MRNTGLLRRLGAIVYDAMLIFALLMLVTVPFVAISGGENVKPGTLIHQLTLLATMYAFFVGYWYFRGRTLGMQAWRIQLEGINGGKPSIGKCSIRFFVSIISWLSAGLGFLWQLWDSQSLTWHDRASGTRLVYYPKDS